MQKVSIVIPAYNEEKRIGKTLKEYSNYFDSISDERLFEYEIIVVINGTTDKTESVVMEYEKLNGKIKHLTYERGGKGFAIIEGFKYALKKNRGFIGFVDADMATPPAEFHKLIKSIDKCNVVIASRGLKNSSVKTSFARKLTNRGFNLIVRLFLFLPFSDTQCGAKLFDYDATKFIVSNMSFTQWAFDIEMLYILLNNGFKIKEIPTNWIDKGGSKINLTKVPIKMFLSVVRLRLVHSPFKFVVKLYDKMPEKLKVHHTI
ncbi:glycosyltransferase family 2 protein [Candidatus Pacearchaeota archaeon]|nr:glycosyltransferase family 2 protein [Candidatus Pacearchaeota archaeon]